MATALITGASAGIGEEFARQLAADGFDLVLVARRTDRLEDLATQLQNTHGVEVLVLAADLSQPGTPHDIFARTGSAGLTIDYLVNNAGMSGPHLLGDRDWADHEAFIRLMITSVAEMCHLYLPGMQERAYGRVINVASVAGLVTVPGGANYGPAKAYVVRLSEELAMLAGPHGVHVTALCPGFTHTEFHDVGGLRTMKSRLPKRLWYPAATVVRDGLKAVEVGKTVQVSGRLYRVMVPLLRFGAVRKIVVRWRSR